MLSFRQNLRNKAGLVLLVVLCFSQSRAAIIISKYTGATFCTTYPSAYVTGSFSIGELKINGKQGFKKNQTSKIFTIGFSAANFSFNPGVGNVSVTGSEVVVNGYTITATQIIVNASALNNNEKNTFIFSGIQVRATAAGTAIICRTGGTQTFLMDNSTSLPSSATSLGDLNAGTPFSISGNSTAQTSTANVFPNSTNNSILHVQYTVAGNCGSGLTATSFSFMWTSRVWSALVSGATGPTRERSCCSSTGKR